MRNALALLLLAGSSAAFAQQKITIVPFSGPGAAAARNQIVAALCDDAECVPQARTVTGGKPDFKKAKKEGVKYFVTGKVTKKGRKATLELQVLEKAGAPKAKKSWPLAGGELGNASLKAARALLSKTMDLGEAAVKPPPEEKEPPEEKAPPEEKPPPEEKADDDQAKEEKKPDKKKKAEEEKKRKEEEKRQREEDERAADEKKDDDAPADEASSGSKHLVLAADLGVEAFGKYFSYTQTGTPNLRSYNAPFAIAPSLRLEFYPLALFNQGLLAGLGLEGGAAFAVGLKSRLPNPTGAEPISYPTSILRIDFGLRWRIRPFAGSDAAIVPLVGMRLHNFSVAAASDGSTIDGLPGISYTALRLGVGGEVPLGELLAVSAWFCVLPLLGYGEIISPTWFTKGSGFGIDAGLAMSLKIAGPLHLKVGGYFTRYGLSFDTQSTDPYVAAGAVDIYAGGFVGLRLAF